MADIESKLNIAKAIAGVMRGISNIEKNLTVGSGNAKYAGVSDKDVKVEFNKMFIEHGLCILPIDIASEVKVDRWQEETTYGLKQKQSVFTQVNVTYLLLHESGESIELAGYGHGVDAQDKGAGKALTYALKNTLLYMTLTPTGSIDDTESTHSSDIDTPTSDDKSWLNKGSGEWTVVVDAIKGGKRTLKDAMQKYKISKVSQEEIKKLTEHNLSPSAQDASDNNERI
jgi:hypothetical protein